MRTIFVLFDTLNRRYLEAYGGTLVKTPNFNRLAERSVTFDNHHVGSMPCMPARRDLQAGRVNFLHRSWGPLEPFDISMPSILGEEGIYTHLTTDHHHYFEDGGSGYHTRYHSYDFLRGQEGDGWKGVVDPPLTEWQKRYHPRQYSDKAGTYPYHYMANREYMTEEKDLPAVQTFSKGMEFIDVNQSADNWFLQIETFDPHEPFYAPTRCREPFTTDYEGPIQDWPEYDRNTLDDTDADELRANYKALLAHCDELLGHLLDKMDALDMWKDTALIVSTDHGYMLGEHDWWAKNRMPVYDEIAHIPLFVHHPHHSDQAGTRRSALTQTPDLMPTILDIFNVDIPSDVTARSIMPLVADPQAKNHDAMIYGYFGGAVNLTDGRYTYYRYPENMEKQEIYQYTLMPTHLFEPFTKDELQNIEIVKDLPFARGYSVMRIPVIKESPMNSNMGPGNMLDTESVIYDRSVDPGQMVKIDDEALEQKLKLEMVSLLKQHSAPPEDYQRLGLA